MISKNELKYIQSFAHKKQWEKESVFIVEGPKMVAEAIAAHWPIQKLYALNSWLEQNNTSGIEIEEVDEIMLERLSHLQTPNQVLALVQKMPSSIHHYENQLTIVLDGLQDPGNVGTIIRTADWFGIKQIIATEDTVNGYHPKLIQSTMGSCFRIQMQNMDIDSILSTTKLPIYGALLEGVSVYDTNLQKKGFLIIGNESKGIRAPSKNFITHPISIPKLGAAESLNAAVAAGILMSRF